MKKRKKQCLVCRERNKKIKELKVNVDRYIEIFKEERAKELKSGYYWRFFKDMITWNTRRSVNRDYLITNDFNMWISANYGSGWSDYYDLKHLLDKTRCSACGRVFKNE